MTIGMQTGRHTDRKNQTCLMSNRNMAVEWSEDECRSLIENVKENEVLWKLDHRTRRLGKRGPRFHAWRRVASAVQKGAF